MSTIKVNPLARIVLSGGVSIDTVCIYGAETYGGVAAYAETLVERDDEEVEMIRGPIASARAQHDAAVARWEAKAKGVQP